MLDMLEGDIASLVTERPASGRARSGRHVTLPKGASDYLWRAGRRLGLVSHVPVSRPALRRLGELVAAPQVEVVLVHYLTTAVKFAPVWKQTEKPIFVHCHGYDVTWDLRSPLPPHARAHPPEYLLQVLALPEHMRLIANSHATERRLLEAGIDGSRISVKYFGVPLPEEPRAARPSQAIDILFLGRLVDFKGPQQVIEAFTLARHKGLAGRLVIAGDGPLSTACRQAQAASPFAADIELLGAVDAETGARLRETADVFTAHSQLGPATGQEEAFGVSFVEAMAASLPVVSGRSGSLPEILADGREGILFKPGDVEAHAGALLRLANDPSLRDQMGRSAWQRARRDYSLEAEESRLREILNLPLDA